MAGAFRHYSTFRGKRENGCYRLSTDYDGAYNRSRLTLRTQGAVITHGNWIYSVGAPENADHVQQNFTVYSVDQAGNPSDEVLSLTFWVDNVAPAITTTQPVAFSWLLASNNVTQTKAAITPCG